MKIVSEKFHVGALVKAWDAGSLTRNEEYQRGEKWKLEQMQGLLDSLFRKYPIPALFLHKKMQAGLDGIVNKFEIVDGQQRIRALVKFYKGEFALLTADDVKLRIPQSLRRIPAPWGAHRWHDLPDDLQHTLDAFEITTFVIEEAEEDEVRDLFIRLQSGTALTRQEVRDAWPGKIGPYVERLAGKLDRHPTVSIFSYLDKRGSSSDEDKDGYEQDRQTCAQLLALYLARESDFGAQPSVGPNELDRLYHDYTAMDTRGVTATRFQNILEMCDEVFEEASAAGRKKVKKLDVFATFLLLQDLTRNQSTAFDQKFYQALGRYLASERDLTGAPIERGKSTSGPRIVSYYYWWRSFVPNLGIALDPKRTFTEDERKQLLERQKGICAICSKEVGISESEGDHFPLPWSLGGKTVLANGRAVHKNCHLRGAAAIAEASARLDGK